METSLSVEPDKTRRRALAGALLAGIVLDAVLLILAPAERTLGQVVKGVYLHGALIRASVLGLLVAGLLALAWLFTHHPPILRRLIALQRAVAVVWGLYLLSSMVVTYLAWGQIIAWGEPRVMTTLRVSAVLLAVLVVTELFRLPILRALGNIVLSAFGVIAVQTTGVIRHPLNPIGSSTSSAIKFSYAGIVLVTIFCLTVLTMLFYEGTGSDLSREG